MIVGDLHGEVRVVSSKNRHGYSKFGEIALVAAKPTRKWRHTVNFFQPKQCTLFFFSNGRKSYRFMLKFTFY